MYMGDPQIHQMIQTGLYTGRNSRTLFRKGKIFPLILNSRTPIYRKIPDMKLIDNSIRWTYTLWFIFLRKPYRIRGIKINHHSADSISANGLCIRIYSLLRIAIHGHRIGIVYSV